MARNNSIRWKIAEIFGTRLSRNMRGKLATVIDRSTAITPFAPTLKTQAWSVIY
jgi:hypothetical protein